VVNQEVVAGLLQRLGVTVILAQNGKEAVERVVQGPVDLVLMDMQMPLMGGLEATQAIRSLEGPTKAVPIVALTSNAFVTDRDECLAAGMNDFLAKPINKSKLAEVIGKWLPKPQLRSPEPVEQSNGSPIAMSTQREALELELGSDVVGTIVFSFVREARFILDALERPDTSPEDIRRGLHSLKGIAETVGFNNLAAATADAAQAYHRERGMDSGRLRHLLDDIAAAVEEEGNGVTAARA
jgi:CheY-like chemotaxis protein